MNKSELTHYLSELNDQNQVSIFVDETFNARTIISHTAHDIQDFLRPANMKLMSQLPFGQHSCDPRTDKNLDLKWIGRPEGIDGNKSITRAELAGEMGNFRQTDIDLLVKFRQEAIKHVDQIDLSAFVAKYLAADDMPCKVDAFNLLMGESWGKKRKKTKAPKESIALVLPLSASCSVDSDVLAAAMAIVVAISEALSDAGFAIELWVTNKGKSVYNSGEVPNFFGAYKIKDTSDPFNDTLISSAASAWFFRSGIFSMMRMLGPGDVSGGLGYPDVVYTDEEKAHITSLIGLNHAHVMKGWDAGSISAEKAMLHMISEITNALSTYTSGEQ
mgnify:FL=1|tara:strand:- start:3868 stop:4860 length:993 start_codon:yes stop_codon:yes gene_type:complete